MNLLPRTFALGVTLAILALAVPASAQSLIPTGLDDIGKTGVFKVGWTSWYPYHFRDPNTKAVTGASQKIIEEIADRWAFLVKTLRMEAATPE